jgi:poly(3-hydroxybutyrate) depolymerase
VALGLLAACAPPLATQPVPSPPAPAGCITDVGPADKLVVSGCGGDITYNVSVPAKCLQYRCGLIFDVHGWTMSGDIQEANTGIAAIGREEGFIVVQPSSADTSWGPLRYQNVAAFMDIAIEVWRVDPRHVHFTGFSMGGIMSWWMRCNRADVVASVAPTGFSGQACTNGARPVPTLYIQGHNDYFVSEANIQATIDSIKTTHQLDNGTVVAQEPDAYVHTRYRNADGYTFETILHRHTQEGALAGHCIIGSNDPGSIYGCDQPSSLKHGRAIVDFFKRHPKS